MSVQSFISEGEAALAQCETMKILIERTTRTIAAMTVASCECSTKTPDPVYHDDSCRYKCLEAALSDLQATSFALNKVVHALTTKDKARTTSDQATPIIAERPTDG